MSKSTSKRIQSQGSLTDRSKAKSSDKLNRSLTYTREIVIRTEEPDIPQITIFKVERVEKGEASLGFQLLIKLFQRVRLKRLFKGFSQICSIYQSSKINIANTLKLANILRNRQKRLVSISWHKLKNSNSQYQVKLNSCRLFWKLFSLLQTKFKSQGFKNLTQFSLSKIKKSTTEISQPTTKKVEQSLQLQLSKLKSQQFSQKFMTLCKKFVKYNNKKFIQATILQLQANVATEIERYKLFRKNQGMPINNQTVLIVLNNHIIAIKDLKKDLEANQSIVKQYQKQDAGNRLIFYQGAEQQFEKADNQIKNSFQRQNRIDEKQLNKILENQLLKWNRMKEHSVYNSRLFITALVVRVAKDGTAKLNEFLNILEGFLRISSDVKKIEEFKKTIDSQQRSAAILIQIVNKFIDLHSFGMPPIMERGFSENQEDFMSEIKYIREQMKDFIFKFNNPTERKKLKKTFSTKKAKAPEELRDLYSTINQLIGLIQKTEPSEKGTETKPNTGKQKNVETFIKIIQTFAICLKQGNYQKWQIFINKQINKDEFKVFLNVLDEINDILNQKITEETANSAQELKKLKIVESKLREEVTNLKDKNSELQKKLKNLEGKQQKKSNQPNQNVKKLHEWQLKYKELSDKFEKLQKSHENLTAKASNEQQLILLRKKVEQKDKQIKKLRDSLAAKDKIDAKDYNQVKQINISLNQNIVEITHKLQITIEQLESKQREIQGIKNHVSQDHSRQILIEKLKNENQGMNRKINIMTNNIESLNREVAQKNKVIEQLERNRNLEQGKRPVRNDKNSENSMSLIRQLNEQLQKLKRSQISLEQINKELENVHHRGQDVQVLISKMQVENSQLKKNQTEKDKMIWDLKLEINRLNNELSLINPHIHTLETELNDKEHNLKRLQNSIRDKEGMFNKQIENKNNYIQKLEGIISMNEKSMAELNLQIQRLKKQSSEGPQNLKYQQELQRRLNELKQAVSKIGRLQFEISQLDKRYQYQKNTWVENQTMLNNQRKKYYDEKRGWEDERQRWSNEKIHLERQMQRWAIQITKWQEDKAKYNSDRERLEIEWKSFIIKYEQATTQNTRLLAQLTELNTTIDQLRYQISHMASSSINIDNIVWLLANITSSFIRIQPKPTVAENEKTSQQIFTDLTAIKEKFSNMQEDMFQNMENYIVSFIEADIGRYRYDLAVKIDDLSALKDRLIQFLNNEIEISKRSLNYQYNYELKESSTAAKSSYETPAKSLDKGFRISQQIKAIKEKTLYARQLF